MILACKYLPLTEGIRGDSNDIHYVKITEKPIRFHVRMYKLINIRTTCKVGMLKNDCRKIFKLLKAHAFPILFLTRKEYM